MSNRILEYIEDIIYMKRHNDKEGHEALRREGRDEYVTLEEAGHALLELMEDMSTYVDTSQAVTEVRMKAIVYSLPEEIQEKIYAQFNEAEDDLFTNTEGEELDYE